MPELTSAQVENILQETAANFPHQACLTCECFLGLVALLGMDAQLDSRPLLDAYKVPRKEMHACLGCDPCPPGESYAKYIRHKQNMKIITL